MINTYLGKRTLLHSESLCPLLPSFTPHHLTSLLLKFAELAMESLARQSGFDSAFTYNVVNESESISEFVLTRRK